VPPDKQFVPKICSKTNIFKIYKTLQKEAEKIHTMDELLQELLDYHIPAKSVVKLFEHFVAFAGTLTFINAFDAGMHKKYPEEIFYKASANNRTLENHRNNDVLRPSIEEALKKPIEISILKTINNNLLLKPHTEDFTSNTCELILASIYQAYDANKVFLRSLGKDNLLDADMYLLSDLDSLSKNMTGAHIESYGAGDPMNLLFSGGKLKADQKEEDDDVQDAAPILANLGALTSELSGEAPVEHV